MAEDLQGLLEKIQSEGVARARRNEQEIIASAEAQAREILEKAKEEASSIVRKAQEEASVSENKGKAAVQQAARDILISLRQEILAELGNVTKNCLAQAMTPEVMGKIVLEMVKAYCEKNPSSDVTAELLLQEKDVQKMTELLKGSFLESFKAKHEILSGGDFSSGLQIGFKGSDVFLDFSDEALKEIICASVGPKLASALKG